MPAAIPHPKSQDAGTAPEVPPELAAQLVRPQVQKPDAAAQSLSDAIINNRATDEVIEDIMGHESDQLLAAQSERRPQPAAKRPGRWRRFWGNRFVRWTAVWLLL